MPSPTETTQSQHHIRGLWVIARDSGMSVFSYYREHDVGNELFSGYMSALTSFLGELGTSSGEFKKIARIGSSYSLSTEDVKLQVREFGNLIFVLAGDKSDDEKVMDRTLRRISEVFRAMYGERAKNDKTASTIDFRNFELVLDSLIKSEQETVRKQVKREEDAIEKTRTLPRGYSDDLNYIRAINVTVNGKSLIGFDEKKDPGYPVEEFSSDRKVSISVLFKRFLHQHFSDWVKFLMEAIQKSNTIPDLGRLHVALLYIDNCLSRKPKSIDRFTLQLIFSGSLTAPEDKVKLLCEPEDSGP